MASPTGSWACDYLAPYIGLRSAEFITRKRRSVLFVVDLLDAERNHVKNATLTLSVQRYAAHAQVFVMRTTDAYHPQYLLCCRWTWWPSDEDNFTFTLKAFNDKDEVIAERTHLVDSRSDRYRQQVKLTLSVASRSNIFLESPLHEKECSADEACL